MSKDKNIIPDEWPITGRHNPYATYADVADSPVVHEASEKKATKPPADWGWFQCGGFRPAQPSDDADEQSERIIELKTQLANALGERDAAHIEIAALVKLVEWLRAKLREIEEGAA